MGFFYDSNEVALLKPRKAAGSKKKVVDISASERGCDACPLQEVWNRISSPCMPITRAEDNKHLRVGQDECDILALAEAPGETEDQDGAALVGPTGQFLRKHVPRRHLERIAMSNTARCRPPGNRAPSALEAHACSIHLENDIEVHDFKAILGLGGIPLSRFITESTITQIHGTKFPVQVGSKVLWYYPVYHPSYVIRSGGERATQYPVYENDLRNFFREVDKWPSPVIENPNPADVILAYNEEDARALFARLKPTRGLDIETSCLRPMQRDARLLSGALSDGDLTFAFPVNHPEAVNEWGLRLLLEAASSGTWVAHNAAFELVWLMFWAEQIGVEFNWSRFEDSMAFGRLYHARETLLNLGILTRIHLGVNVKKLTNINPQNMLAYSLSEILPYNGLDAWGSVKLFDRLEGTVQKSNYERILGAVETTAGMELMGVPISVERAQELKDKWNGIAEEHRKAASTLYEVKQFERERQREFNIGSTDDVGIALTEYGRVTLPKTNKGEGDNLATDDSVLSKIDNPLCPHVLGYREATKHVSTYIEPALKVPERYSDGCIHPSYSTMLVRTGRHGANDPSIQNWPKRKHRELRSEIVAPPGQIFCACDEGQLEARVYGMASKDHALCSSIISGEDIHTYWLSRVLAEYPEYMDRLREKVNQANANEVVVRKFGRDIIKTDFVFASFFGTHAENCSERTGIPFIYMRDLLVEFWERYPQAAQWLKDRKKEYRDTGGVRTLTGRLRYGHLPGQEPINTPIQGTAADLVIDAENELCALSRELKDRYLHPRMNQHDDLTFLLPDHDDRIDEYIPVIAEAMTRVRYPWQIVPLNVEVKIGYNWQDMHEVTVITGDYVR